MFNLGSIHHSQSSQQQVKRVQRPRRHRSLHKSEHNSSIHVTVKSTKSHQRNNHNSIKLHQNLRSISTVPVVHTSRKTTKIASVRNDPIILPVTSTSCSNTTESDLNSISSLQSLHKNQRDRPMMIKETALFEKGVVRDHHGNSQRNRKTNYSSCLLIGIIITAILLAVLYKPKTSNRAGTITLRWNSTGIDVYGVDAKGNASDLLNGPWDLVFDSMGALYTTDRYNKRVQKYLNNASHGITVTKFPNGTTASSPSALQEPTGLIVDPDGNLYIANRGNHRVVFWPKNASIGSMCAGNGRNKMCLSKYDWFIR
ncbi:hypothetical protein I4U23_020060 [Adineta vaga]|nr:hypothetical protein I4U23_020060 [Adineta vaga]